MVNQLLVYSGIKRSVRTKMVSSSVSSCNKAPKKKKGKTMNGMNRQEVTAELDRIRKKMVEVNKVVDSLLPRYPHGRGLHEALIVELNRSFGEKAVLVSHGYGVDPRWENSLMRVITLKGGLKSYNQLMVYLCDSPIRPRMIEGLQWLPYFRCSMPGETFVIKENGVTYSVEDQQTSFLNVETELVFRNLAIEVLSPILVALNPITIFSVSPAEERPCKPVLRHKLVRISEPVIVESLLWVKPMSSL